MVPFVYGQLYDFCLMYSRNLFVLDFARRFFVSCAQIFEAYAVRTLIKFGCDWRKIGRKGKCMKDSESTFLCSPGIFLCLIPFIRPSGRIRNFSCKAHCLSTLFLPLPRAGDLLLSPSCFRSRGGLLFRSSLT